MKRKTAKQRFRRALREIKDWLKRVRNVYRLPLIWKVAGLKLRGHFNYFGVTDNSQALYRYAREVEKLLFKWLNRRSQRRSFTWEQFRLYQARFPLPRPGRPVSLHTSSQKTV